MLPLISKAIIDIFKPKSFLSEVRAMDVLFRGIPIDCSSDNFAAQAVCTALEGSSTNIKSFNESHFQFSFMGGVNIIHDKNYRFNLSFFKSYLKIEKCYTNS